MRSDTLRQAVTVAAFLVVMVSNIAANAVPIGGLSTKAISDQFSVYVIPAGYVFSIWGLIYLLQGAFTTWQALPRSRESAVLRSLGYLPALSGVLNTAWILLFQYQVFGLTVPVIVGLLATLVVIHLRLWAARDQLRGTTYWVIRAPWSVYLGWVTVATIANTAQTLSWAGVDGFGIEPALIAAAVLGVGVAIAATFVTRFRDVAYGLVFVWAYVGVAVQESDTVLVAAAAGLGAALMAVLSLAALVRGRTGGAGRTVSTAAAA